MFSKVMLLLTDALALFILAMIFYVAGPSMFSIPWIVMAYVIIGLPGYGVLCLSLITGNGGYYGRERDWVNATRHYSWALLFFSFGILAVLASAVLWPIPQSGMIRASIGLAMTIIGCLLYATAYAKNWYYPPALKRTIAKSKKLVLPTYGLFTAASLFVMYALKKDLFAINHQPDQFPAKLLAAAVGLTLVVVPLSLFEIARSMFRKKVLPFSGETFFEFCAQWAQSSWAFMVLGQCSISLFWPALPYADAMLLNVLLLFSALAGYLAILYDTDIKQWRSAVAH